MGTYVSMFEKSDEESKIILHPNKGDFITGHADLTGRKCDLISQDAFTRAMLNLEISQVAVVEVQRMWHRFRQLGCDKKGYLSKKMIESDDISNDVFLKNVFI